MSRLPALTLLLTGLALACTAPQGNLEATVVAQGRGEKIRIFKLRRRKHFAKTQGHRQGFTEVRIDEIVGA